MTTIKTQYIENLHKSRAYLSKELEGAEDATEIADIKQDLADVDKRIGIYNGLDETQLERIASIERGKDETLRQLQEQERGRMERYYDCVDDYSWGGICSQVNAQAQSTAQRRADALIAQIINGGYLTGETRQLCLFDLEGNFITDHIIQTRYGYAFVYDGTFVNIAKRQATYAKKGYIAKTRVRSYKFVFTGNYTRKGNRVYQDLELLEETFKTDEEIELTSFSQDWLDWLYMQRKK